MNKRTVLERFTSRPFLLTVISSASVLLSNRFNVPTETMALFTAPVLAFILGESYRDGKASEAEGQTQATPLQAGISMLPPQYQGYANMAGEYLDSEGDGIQDDEADESGVRL